MVDKIDKAHDHATWQWVAGPRRGGLGWAGDCDGSQWAAAAQGRRLFVIRRTPSLSPQRPSPPPSWADAATAAAVMVGDHI